MGEWQNGDLGLYDFGARLYNPVLARWQCTDPMDQFDSPYNAMGNNPVINIDPDGMFSIPWGAILSNVGNALSSIRRTTTQLIGYNDFVNGMSEPMYATTRTGPLAKLGSALNIAGTILSMGMDAKAILDAAGEMGGAMQTENTPLYYSYYFDRYGTFLKKELKENGDAVFVAENDATSFDDLTFSGYRGDFVKDYIAVICGESASREDAAGIGTVIQNRFDTQTTPQRTAEWWNNLGGSSQYDATSVTTAGNGFPDIQELSIDEILTNAPPAYIERIKGALTALSNTSRSEINGWLDNPYFWEGKSSYTKGGYFFDNVASEIYQLVGQAGGSYFFHYNPKRTVDFNRGWQ